MISNPTRRAVLDARAAVLLKNEKCAWPSGVQCFPDPQVNSKARITAFCADGGALLFTNKQLVPRLKSSICQGDQLTPTLTTFRRLLPDIDMPRGGEEAESFRAGLPAGSSDGAVDVRILSHEDSEIFEQFMASCSERDKRLGQVSLDDAVAVGALSDGGIVGVASYWFEGPLLADIGVLVRPKYRRMNVGHQLVSALMAEGSARGKVHQYRYDLSNLASAALAARLGFKPLIHVFWCASP